MGHVKTRLAQRLGDQHALTLYRCFVADILATLSQGRHRVRIFFEPAEAEDELADWLGKKWELLPQIGSDLGGRMAAAFRQCYRDGYRRVVLIGSDIPDLTNAVIDKAFDVLAQHDVAIGPSLDGGYYLLALRHPHWPSKIFENIPWGSAQVLARTIVALKQHASKVYQLPIHRDLDHYEDLENFIQTCKSTQQLTSQTYRYLTQIGLPASP